MRPTLRLLWLRLHRWIALGLGCVLVLAGLLGSLLTLAKPLDRWVNQHLFVHSAPADRSGFVSLDQVRGQLNATFGSGTGYTFRPPREPDDTLWVYVRGAWEGVVYFDAQGRELGRRGETEGVYNLIFELHSSLLLGEAGQAILTAAAVSYLFLLVTGLVLWWPRRWPPSFRVHWRAGLLRLSSELHNTLGVLLGVLIAVSVASGAYMAWPPLRTVVTAAAGQAPAKPPLASKVPAATTPKAVASLDAMTRQARALFPQAMVGYVQVPSEANQPVRVRLKTDDDPHPNGLTSVWFDPTSGAVLNSRRWSELDAGNRLVSTMYPLHTGALGGPLHEVLVGVTGLALTALGAAGLLLWWTRRSVRLRKTAAYGTAGWRG